MTDSPSPNTPRERLAEIRDSIGWQVDSDIRQQVMDLIDFLLDSGLLDQAGSGERQGAAEAQARSGTLSATDATIPANAGSGERGRW